MAMGLSNHKFDAFFPELLVFLLGCLRRNRMRIPSLLVLVSLLAAAQPAKQPWQQIRVLPLREVAAHFKTPPREYGAIQPWIGWNGEHAREIIVQDFDRMVANGFFVANIV